MELRHRTHPGRKILEPAQHALNKWLAVWRGESLSDRGSIYGQANTNQMLSSPEGEPNLLFQIGFRALSWLRESLLWVPIARGRGFATDSVFGHGQVPSPPCVSQAEARLSQAVQLCVIGLAPLTTDRQ